MTFEKSKRSLDFGPMFMEAGHFSPGEAVVLDAVNQPITVRPEDFQGVIITGSLAMVTDLLPWTQAVLNWLAQAVRLGIPILGICYGHHLLATVYGGQVDYHPAGMELGSHEIVLYPEARDYPLLQVLPDRFAAYLVHSQSVLRPPSKAKVLASSNHDPNQILAYAPNVLSCQFHPEFSAFFMSELLDEMEGYSAPAGRPAGVVFGQEPMAINHSQKLLRLFADLALGKTLTRLPG
jgi:GMP synthase (glutamine-hydrolysing)